MGEREREVTIETATLREKETVLVRSDTELILTYRFKKAGPLYTWIHENSTKT